MNEKGKNINLIDIQERFNDFLNHLKTLKLIVQHKDIAEKGIVSQASLSRAVKGNKNYLTENLVRRIVDAFPEAGYTFKDVWHGKDEKKEIDHTPTIGTNEEVNLDNFSTDELLRYLINRMNTTNIALFARLDIQDRDIERQRTSIKKLASKIDNIAKIKEK